MDLDFILRANPDYIEELYRQYQRDPAAVGADWAHFFAGFELGADEYLPKPFHLKEFLLRVRHVLTTQPTSPPRRVLTVGDVTIDWEAMAITRAGGDREFLQVRDYKVLELLVEAAPRVLSRSEILDRVWGEQEFPTQRTVDNAIVRLRQALGDTEGQLIRSVRGIGYQWAASSK